MLVKNEVGKKDQDTISRLIPLTDWPKLYAWPPLGGLRHLVFNADKNGFSKVIRRVGRRVLIDENAFFSWVNSQQKENEK